MATRKKAEVNVNGFKDLNIDIDDGFLPFTVNRDKNRIVRINPTDIGAFERLQTLFDRVNEQADRKESMDFDELGEFDREIKKELNKAVNDPNAAYNLMLGQHVLGTNESGDLILIAILEALMNLYETGVEKYEQDIDQSIKKYTAKYEKIKATPQDHKRKGEK